MYSLRQDEPFTLDFHLMVVFIGLHVLFLLGRHYLQPGRHLLRHQLFLKQAGIVKLV